MYDFVNDKYDFIISQSYYVNNKFANIEIE